jgi:hypothetical protein
MIPPPWTSIILTLAAYRLTRLIGWDEFPLAQKTRAWLTGRYWTKIEGDVELEWGYLRPLLAHFLACPFCQGFWVSVLTYIAWLQFPTQTLYVAVPFALSGAVGLISKNWDA